MKSGDNTGRKQGGKKAKKGHIKYITVCSPSSLGGRKTY